jgi:penicillin-binding protein 2
MIVENGGFGAAGAAPIAKLAVDYFLLGKRPDDKSKELLKMMDTDNPAVEKVDASLMQSESEVKAEAESEGGPAPGATSPAPKN